MRNSPASLADIASAIAADATRTHADTNALMASPTPHRLEAVRYEAYWRRMDLGVSIECEQADFCTRVRAMGSLCAPGYAAEAA